MMKLIFKAWKNVMWDGWNKPFTVGDLLVVVITLVVLWVFVAIIT